MGLILIDLFIIALFTVMGGLVTFSRLTGGEWVEGFMYGCVLATIYNLTIIFVPKPDWMFRNWFKKRD